MKSFGELVFHEELLTSDDLYTLPILVRALSESRTRVKTLRIGCRCDAYTILYEFRGVFGPSQLIPKALTAAFHHPDICAHASRVMSDIEILVINEIDVTDSRHDLLNMAAAIRYMTSHSPKLRRVEIGEICSSNRLSIEDLFEPQSLYHLQHINLTHLRIPSSQDIVAFLRHHACALVHVELVCVHLIVERYTYFPLKHQGT